MPLRFVNGDPLLTRAQTLAFGHNAAARAEVGPLETRLMTAHPAAFASYRKQCRNRRVKAGGLWLWTESQPRLLFLTVRETPVGQTRTRYLDSALLTLARDYRLYGITSLAIAPLAPALEWDSLKTIVVDWLFLCPADIAVYEAYCEGLAGE
jgi:hypothetical protein